MDDNMYDLIDYIKARLSALETLRSVTASLMEEDEEASMRLIYRHQQMQTAASMNELTKLLEHIEDNYNKEEE